MKNTLQMVMAISALYICGTISSSSNVYGDGSSDSLTAEQIQFITSYVSAVNSNDLERLKKLIHPRYLDCINDSNRDYYDALFTRSIERSIPINHEVTFETLSVEEVLADMEASQKQGFTYPVRPTHQVQIDYAKSEYSFVTVSRKLSLHKGRYYEVSGCPAQKMIDRFREARVRKEESRKRSKVLFNELKGDILMELTVLMKQGKKIQAWKLYSEKTGESIGTAKDVLSNVSVVK